MFNPYVNLPSGQLDQDHLGGAVWGEAHVTDDPLAWAAARMPLRERSAGTPLDQLRAAALGSRAKSSA